MMSTGYSTLFSLGLSNIHTSFPRELDAAGPNSAITPITLSATPSTPSSSCPFSPPPPKIQIDTQLPNFHTARRRRSSVTAAQSPLASMGVKSPGRSASRAAASPAARTRHRRSESDAILRLKASSSLDVQRATRRSAVKTPAQAPPNAPLPAVPALPAEYASQRVSSLSAKTSSPIRPPSDTSYAYPYRRVYLSDKDHALNANGSRSSIPVPPSATSTGSCLLTPGFASKLVLALSTPPHSAYSGSMANAVCSPVDPILGAENHGSFHL